MEAKQLFIILLVFAWTPNTSSSIDKNNDKIMKCKKVFRDDLDMFEVLPGIGWDNLENIEKGRIFQLGYNTCKPSTDAKFIIPDQVTIIPVRKTTIDQFAEVMDTMEQFSSVTAKSINKESSFNLLFLSHSYSSEYRKTKLLKTKHHGMSSTFRVQARYQRYISMLGRDVTFHPDFKKRLLQIAENILHDNKPFANYLSQLIVRDYGTHVIVKYDVGGLIIKEDEVLFNSESDRKQNTESYKESSATHFNIIFVRVDTHHKKQNYSFNENVQKYLNKVHSSEIKANGGPIVTLDNFSISDWLAKLENNMVPLDRNGIPLHELITSHNFKEIPENTIPKLQTALKQATEMYYKRNTYYGCTKIGNKNFNARANIDDGMCNEEQHDDFMFGGVYQICEMVRSDNGNICNEITLNNHLTDKPYCPNGFKSTQIHERLIQRSRTKIECKAFFFFEYMCQEIVFTSYASVKSYWCGMEVHDNDTRHYGFGGAYSDFQVNSATNDKSCPNGYQHATIAGDLTFCFTDHKNAVETGLKFGGIYTCTSGNAVAGGFKRCPPGYSKYILSTDGTCDVILCLGYKNLSGMNQTLPQIGYPPFSKMPQTSTGKTSRSKQTVLVDYENNWFINENVFRRIFEIDQSKNFKRIAAIFNQFSFNLKKLTSATVSLFWTSAL